MLSLVADAAVGVELIAMAEERLQLHDDVRQSIEIDGKDEERCVQGKDITIEPSTGLNLMHAIDPEKARALS